MTAAALTALGIALDWGMRPQTKDRLRTELEKKLYKFAYVTPRNFGRAEVDFSIGAFEKLAGSRYWSLRRWGFVVVTALVALSVAVLRLDLSISDFSHSPDPNAPREHIAEILTRIASTLALANLSITWTIWVSKAVTRLPGGTTILGSFLLLLIHTFGFVFWYAAIALAVNRVGVGIFPYPAPFSWSGLSKELAALPGLFRQIAVEFEWSSWLDDAYGVELPRLQYVKVMVRLWLVGDFLVFWDQQLAWLLNVARLVLASAFVACVLYVHILRRALIWFWSALVRSRAIFAPPLSAISALIVVIDRRLEIVEVLRHLLIW